MVSILQKGFSIIELMIIVIVIAIIAAVAYPNYQKHIIKTKRVDMMTELTAMGGKIEAIKLAQGSYSKVNTADYKIDFPRTGIPLYKTKMEKLDAEGNVLDDNSTKRVAGWKLTAKPIETTMMGGDGDLTYSSQGIKCRASACGSADEWKN